MPPASRRGSPMQGETALSRPPGAALDASFGVADFDAMTDIARACAKCSRPGRSWRRPRGRFGQAFRRRHAQVPDRRRRRQRRRDGLHPEDDRGTLCVSTQAGCALDCAFCSTGKQGFNRNLTVAEIIGQVWQANHALGAVHGDERAISNVVLMGMGEPWPISIIR